MEEEDDDFVGCISCMNTKELYDLFSVYTENGETYANMLETCFDVKVSEDLKYICSLCVQKLENAAVFKDQTVNNLALLQSIKDEEYVDDTILDNVDGGSSSGNKKQVKKLIEKEEDEDVDDDHAIQALDETTCIYCDLSLTSVDEVKDHVRSIHGLEPRTGQKLKPCGVCGEKNSKNHVAQCKGINSESDGKQYPCHFCHNVYTSRKACFTHLRMKHGLKLCNEQTPKPIMRERKKCPMCSRDFSQKQILNKHLLKMHGIEVEKRKAFICPVCEQRVSYGAQFSAHLLREHSVRERVESLQFDSMRDFLLYKNAVQEETKFRFRKTTASKQTIEGLRSHYMCSQSGVYVYQGKGKRPAPERQIYKSGRACPAHIIVTETMDKVLVTFHKTHVGHGACPYYEPREPKRPRPDASASASEMKVFESSPHAATDQNVGAGAPAASWVCESCGMGFPTPHEFGEHAAAHRELLLCRYCHMVFQNIDAWTTHLSIAHNVGKF